MNTNTRILIVDGSRGTRRILSHKLEKLGFSPMSAGSSNQALAKLRATPADIICTALSLPDESALQFISALRKLPGSGHSPVLVMSGKEIHSNELDPTDTLDIAATIDKGEGIDYIVGKITEFCEFGLTNPDQITATTV